MASYIVHSTVCEYGNPLPVIELHFDKSENYRARTAAVFTVAAAVELASPAKESWMVTPEPRRNRVVIELTSGYGAEVDSALATLNAVKLQLS